LAQNPLAGNLRLGRRFPRAYFAAWAVNGAALAATGLAGSVSDLCGQKAEHGGQGQRVLRAEDVAAARLVG
jgi:hypothetical protein